MNKRLQAILDQLQNSESLTPDEKRSLVDAVKESDKEITITEFKLERTEKLKRTTAILLEETIAELEEKRKSVEAQNRELEIEASLERVRARSIAMHRSEELLQVITIVSEQLEHLGFKFNTVSFAINNQEYDYKFWFAIMGNPSPLYIEVPYINNKMFEGPKDVISNGGTFYADYLLQSSQY